MGKKPNTQKAEKLQKQTNTQQQKNFERQMKMMQQQMDSAESIQMPSFEAPPPGPTMSSQDVAASGRETRMRSRRRYGFNQSVSANAPGAGLGTPTAL